MADLAIGTSVLSVTLRLACDKAIEYAQKSFLGATKELESALEKFQETLSIVNSILSDAEKRTKRGESDALRIWLLNLRNIVYDAEDVLDGMEYDRLKSRVMKTSRFTRGSLRYIATKLKPLSFSAHSYVLRINAIQERLSLFLSMETVFKHEMVAEASMPISDNSSQLRMISSSIFYDKAMVLGREKEKDDIISLLLKLPTSSDSPSTETQTGTISGGNVVGIIGMGGLGKTTLAHLIFDDTKVNNHFDLKLWVCVSDAFDVERIVEDILKSILVDKLKTRKDKKSRFECEGYHDDEKEDAKKNHNDARDAKINHDNARDDAKLNYEDEKDPQEKLKDELKGNRFLLVLDDIWNEEIKKWRDMVTLVNYGKEGSKILFTTRIKSIASRIHQLKLIDLDGLSENHMQSLLMEHVGCDLSDEDLKKISANIIEKLKGSPLAAKTIGRILSTELSEVHWNSILKSELWDLPQKEGDIMPALQISFERLPNHLKPCFAFCSLFPKDYQYNKIDIVEMWISLGLVQQDRGRSILLEDMGRKYVNELLNMCMFQPYKHDENVFTIHDLIHDVATMVSKDEIFLVQHQSCIDHIPNTVRQLAINVDYMENWDLVESFTNLPKLRSLIFHCKSKYGFTNYDQILARTMTFLTKKLCTMKSLRILCLNSLVVTHIPRGFSNLRCLRYLNFFSKYKKRLPGSLSKLYHMQVLVLQDAFPPKGIHNLVNLRHVRMESYSISNQLRFKDIHNINLQHALMELSSQFEQLMFKGIDHIKGLKLLQEVDVKLLPKDGTKIRMLSDMKHMRDLRIKGVENIKNLEEATQAGLSHKNHLTSLELRWHSFLAINKQSTTSEILEGLQPNKNIKRLSIVDCPSDKAPNWLNTNSLQNIQEIDLSGCKKWQSLSDLQQLSHLKSLHLYNMTNLTHIAPDMFRKDSVVLNQVTDPFSYLSRIDISNCSQLTNFLSWIPPTTRELRVVDCSNIGGVSTSSQVNLSVEGWLPPALKKLELNDCGALGDMLVSKDLENLSHLEVLALSNCKNIESIPASCSTHIQQMELRACASLRRVSPSALKDLRDLTISRCHEFVMTHDDSEGFHVLRKLTISGLKNIKSMENCFVTSTSLKHLTLRDLADLRSLPTRLCELSALESLEIDNCPQIDALPERGLPPSLKKLSIFGLTKILSMENCFVTSTSLKHLLLQNLPRLRSLPTRLCELSALEILFIYDCNEVDALPERGLPQSLKFLRIRGCPKLQKRFSKEAHKVSHVKHVSVQGHFWKRYTHR